MTVFASPVTSRPSNAVLAAVGVSVVAGSLFVAMAGRGGLAALTPAHGRIAPRATGFTLRGKLRRTAAEAAPLEVTVPAAPFVLQAANGPERERAVQCLTRAVYYEAALEPVNGQRAVAQVVLNRVRDPNFPKSVCGVVYQGWEKLTGCQFSFTCDGSLARAPMASYWRESRLVAEQALGGHVEGEVGTATHYHTTAIDPWWRPSVVRVAQVGTHIFYRWPGAAGRLAAFTGRYAGGETRLSEAVLTGRAPRPSQAFVLDPGLETPGVSRIVVADAAAPGGLRSRVRATFGMGGIGAAPTLAALPAAPSKPSAEAVRRLDQIVDRRVTEVPGVVAQTRVAPPTSPSATPTPVAPGG